MNRNNNPTIQEKITEAIKSGRFEMRPRWQFLLKAGLWMSGLLLALFFLIFLWSFIIFNLNQNGLAFVPRFGIIGLYIFLLSLPWLLVALALVFMFIVQLLVKKYSFSYGHPLFYSGLGIIVISVVGGFLVAATPIHMGLMARAHCKKLPLAGPVYLQYGRPSRQIIIGEVREVGEDTYRLGVVGGEDVLTKINLKTRRIPRDAKFSIGDKILVLGNRKNGHTEAISVKRAERMALGPNPGPATCAH